MSPKPCLVKISPSISNNERRIQNSVSKVRKTHLDEVLKKKKKKKKGKKKKVDRDTVMSRKSKSSFEGQEI